MAVPRPEKAAHETSPAQHVRPQQCLGTRVGWFLLAAVADLATALLDTIVEKGADHEAHVYPPRLRLCKDP